MIPWDWSILPRQIKTFLDFFLDHNKFAICMPVLVEMPTKSGIPNSFTEVSCMKTIF